MKKLKIVELKHLTQHSQMMQLSKHAFPIQVQCSFLSQNNTLLLLYIIDF